MTHRKIKKIVLNYTHKQVNDKGLDNLQKEFEKKLQVKSDDFGKAVETITSSITKVNNHLSKQINEVQAKVAKFFKLLLENKEVASQSEIEDIHK